MWPLPRYDRPDGYLISGMKSNASGRGGSRRCRRLCPCPAAPPRQSIEQDDNRTVIFLRSDGPSSTACTTTGECLVVWDHIDNCGAVTLTQFVLTDEGKDHVTSGVEINIYFAPDGGPNPTPNDQVWQKMWSWSDTNWLDMDTGAVVGPNAYGLPKTLTFCNPNDPVGGKNYYSRLQVWESDSDGQEDVGHARHSPRSLHPARSIDASSSILGPSDKDGDNYGVRVQVQCHGSAQDARHRIAGAIVDPPAPISCARNSACSDRGSGQRRGRFHACRRQRRRELPGGVECQGQRATITAATSGGSTRR